MFDLPHASSMVRDIIARAHRGLVGRQSVVELAILSAVAGEHMLVIGPPGTAKSEAIRRVARQLGGEYFEYLLGRFTEPSEIFGPVDLQKLREGVVQTRTDGMLPEAEVAFLDEVFLGSTAILNTLLGILNERSFRRGHTRVRCPLRVCVGASNKLPDDPSLAAFADRFLVQIFVEPTEDPRLEELLAAGWSCPPSQSPATNRDGIDALQALSAALHDVDVQVVRPHLGEALRILRSAGITLSDRRMIKTQQLIAAAALLDGRMSATGADLWPIIYTVPEAEGQQRARDLLRDLLSQAQSQALPTAAEEASAGPIARAHRLIAAGEALLASQPNPHDEDARRRWMRQLEGLARELDAGFIADSMPPRLAELRAALVNALQPGGPEHGNNVR